MLYLRTFVVKFDSVIDGSCNLFSNKEISCARENGNLKVAFEINFMLFRIDTFEIQNFYLINSFSSRKSDEKIINFEIFLLIFFRLWSPTWFNYERVAA